MWWPTKTLVFFFHIQFSFFFQSMIEVQSSHLSSSSRDALLKMKLVGYIFLLLLLSTLCFLPLPFVKLKPRPTPLWRYWSVFCSFYPLFPTHTEGEYHCETHQIMRVLSLFTSKVSTLVLLLDKLLPAGPFSYRGWCGFQ